ncbi:MAG: DNA recombination protein RmuC [Gemmatimonadota bacterium]
MPTLSLLLPSVIAAAALAVALVVLLRRPTGPDPTALARTITDAVARDTERLDRAIRDETARVRTELDASLTRAMEQRLGALDARVEALRGSVDQRLAAMQQDNAAQLDRMRATVEEKLQATLETRLGESFRTVGEQLARVQQGLGEMQALADGVGDLKRVMSGVRTRGTIGELRLEALLEQVLTPAQFARNVKPVPGRDAIVEFAVKVPRRDADGGSLWLPIDAKYPAEAYDRLLTAEQAADRAALEQARADLAQAVRVAAADIAAKYVAPPHTMEFGILFLPSEGLFAEVVRTPGLVESLHAERVLVTGPTTLAAMLDMVQMGVRVLALEQRSREVWEVLGAVKTQFEKFGAAMDVVRRRLELAAKGVDDVDQRTRAMRRALTQVEALPDPAAAARLGPIAADAADAADAAGSEDDPPA